MWLNDLNGMMLFADNFLCVLLELKDTVLVFCF